MLAEIGRAGETSPFFTMLKVKRPFSSTLLGNRLAGDVIKSVSREHAEHLKGLDLVEECKQNDKYETKVITPKPKRAPRGNKRKKSTD